MAGCTTHLVKLWCVCVAAVLKEVLGDLYDSVPGRSADRSLGENVPVVGVERDQGNAASAVRLNEVVFSVDGLCGCAVCVLCKRHCVCESGAILHGGGHVCFDGGFEAPSCNYEAFADTGREKQR